MTRVYAHVLQTVCLRESGSSEKFVSSSPVSIYSDVELNAVALIAVQMQMLRSFITLLALLNVLKFTHACVYTSQLLQRHDVVAYADARSRCGRRFVPGV